MKSQDQIKHILADEFFLCSLGDSDRELFRVIADKTPYNFSIDELDRIERVCEKFKTRKFTFQTGQAYTLYEIPLEFQTAFLSCSHSGPCDSDVENAKQFFAVDNPAKLRTYLKEFGAWDESELADDDANLGRILWIMAGEIKENSVAYIGV